MALEHPLYDASWASVVSLLEFEGTDGDTTTTDEVASPPTWTMAGGAQISDAYQKFSNTCLISVAGDTVAADVGDIPDFSTGDFTIEGWVFGGASAAGRAICDFRRSNGDAIGGAVYVSSSVIRYFTGGADVITGTTGIWDSIWHHWAICRVSGVTRLFVDGVQEGSNYADTADYAFGGTYGFTYGNAYATGLPLLGYLDNCRITVGVGRYAADFPIPQDVFAQTATVPDGLVADPDPIFQQVVTLNSFEDGWIGATGEYYDGGANAALGALQGKWGGDGLLVTDGAGGGSYASALGLLDGYAQFDHTIEFWYKPSTMPAGGDFDYLFCYEVSTVQDTPIFLYQSKIYWRDRAGTELVTPTTWPGDLYSWSFVRAIRYMEGGVWQNELYIDGVLLASGTAGVHNEVATARIMLGTFNTSTQQADGTFSDLRVTVGTARVGTEVPIAPFSSVDNRVADRFFDDIILFVNGGGTDATSAVEFTGATVGSPFGDALYSDTQTKFASTSVEFSADKLDYDDIVPGALFTFDTWVYYETTDTAIYIFDRRDGYQIGIGNNSSKPALITNGFYRITAAVHPALDEWHHYAVTFDGLTYTFFINGVSQGTYNSADDHLSGQITLGSYSDVDAVPPYGLDGFLEDFRLTTAVRWPGADFLVPTAQAPQARFIDGLEPTILDADFGYVTALMALDSDTTDILNNVWTTLGDPSFVGTGGPFATNGYADLDGTGDTFTVPYATWMDPTIAFTVEVQVNIDTLPASDKDVIFGIRYDAPNAYGWNLYIYPAGELVLQAWDNSTVRVNVTSVDGIITEDTWHAVALTRTAAGIWNVWVDGAPVLTVTESATVGIHGSCTLKIGTESDGSRLPDGWFSDFRYTSGLDRYTTIFAVPTEQFNDVDDDYSDDVVSLLHFDTDLTDESGKTWTAVNNAIWSASKDVYAGDGSLSVPSGGSSRIHTPHHADFDFADGDFTVECWFFYETNQSDFFDIFSKRDAPTEYGPWVIRCKNDDLRFSNSTNGSAWAASEDYPASINTGEWTHLAMVRKGDLIYHFANGVLLGTAELTGSLYSNTYKVNIGGSGTFECQGYIDEARVTKGVARYAELYTPATEPFAAFEYDPYEEIVYGPVIGTQPVGDTVEEEEEASYTVEATGTGTLTYQWYETTAGLISGETAATLDFITVLADDGNGYYVIVTDDVGPTQSDTASLTVTEIPTALRISTDPVSGHFDVGDAISLTVVAAGGSESYTYQWYKDSVAVAGETTDTLAMTAAKTDEGSYYCVVDDGAGDVSSGTAIITVARVLAVVTHPGSDALDPGEEIELSVSVIGDGPFSYAWTQDGAPVGGNSNILAVFGYDSSLGDYVATITDVWGTALASNAATITLNATTPTFLINNTDQTVSVGQVATFYVNAVYDHRGVAYQWSEVGVGDLAGETGQSYEPETQLTDTGRQFICTLTNVDGSLASDTATLTVQAITLDDQSEPRTPSDPQTPEAPRYLHQDWVGLQLAAEGKTVEFHDEYRFRGRTFTTRSPFTNPKDD